MDWNAGLEGSEFSGFQQIERFQFSLDMELNKLSAGLIGRFYKKWKLLVSFLGFRFKLLPFLNKFLQ